MIRRIRISTSTVLLLFSLSSTAQTHKNLSLSEAIELSLKNNNELRLSKAKIDEAAASLQSAKEQRLPEIKISGSYLRMNEPTVDLKLKLGEGEESGSGSGNGDGAPNSNSSVRVDQAAYVMGNLTVPVFSGFRIQNGIEAAKYLKKAAELDAEKSKEEVIANTIAAYSNLYKSKSTLELVHENLKQSEQRVKDFSNLEKNGLLARNDLLKAQLQQSNVELALLDAQNNWKLTNISMNLMLGLPQEIELIPDSSFRTINDTRAYSYWEGLALQNRKDAQALEYRAKAADAGIKAAKGEYYPSFAVTSGYIAAHVPNLLTITNAINVGIGLSYSPSSLWKTGSKVAEAKAQLNQVKAHQDILSDAIRLQVAEAYQSFLMSQKKIDVYAKAVEQATENYRIVNNKYQNALATTTDLLEADVAQLQAKLNYAYAQADAVVAYKKLQQSAGVLDNTHTHNNAHPKH